VSAVQWLGLIFVLLGLAYLVRSYLRGKAEYEYAADLFERSARWRDVPYEPGLLIRPSVYDWSARGDFEEKA
jgi:hypothetical protein